MEQLKDNIFEIGLNTEFNGKKLLDGSQDSKSWGNSISLQIGANAGQVVTFDIDNIFEFNPSFVSFPSLSYSGNDVSFVIERLDMGSAFVSGVRAKLGAVQNRLEHIVKSLDNTSENLQAAESGIRDTDMAKEMMEFTKKNILNQASQSMLAQANQMPQGILRLIG